jgi:hypothetical protein
MFNWLRILIDVYVLRRFTPRTKAAARQVKSRSWFVRTLAGGNAQYPQAVLTEARWWLKVEFKQWLRL